MRRLFLAVLVLSALNAAAAVRSRAARVPCMVASGLPGFYISRDEGRTFTVNFDPVPVNAGVHIALSDVVNRLYAAFEDGVFQSSDGGCTWSLRGRVGAGFWMGVAAGELMVRGKWRGPGLGLSSAIFLATWLAAIEWIRADLWAALLAAAYVLVIAGAARADIHGLRSPWRSRPMVWLGEVSFAFIGER